jgi:hypothetical protein
MLVFPDHINFTFKPSKKKQKWKSGKETGNQLYDFVYTESFDTPNEIVMKRTFDQVKVLETQGFKVTRIGNKGFRIRGTGDREMVSSMVVGEFFVHSQMGNTKLGDIWQAACVGAFYAENVRAGALP